jgi:hypothetical protein
MFTLNRRYGELHILDVKLWCDFFNMLVCSIVSYACEVWVDFKKIEAIKVEYRNVVTPLWGKCEVATHTPENGSCSPLGLPKIQKMIAEVKTPRIEVFFIPLERSQSVDVQNGLTWVIWTFAAQVWAKERPGVKLPIWLSTTKSLESTRSQRAPGECNTTLESSQRELQHWLRPRPDQRSGQEAMTVQSLGSPNRDNFGIPLWESWDKKPFGCSLRGVTLSILYGGRWWLLSSPGRGESSESKCPWLVPTPKGVPECELTLLWLVLDADSCEIIIVLLPSLISGLLTRPSYPL